MPTHDNLIALAKALDVLIVVLPGGQPWFAGSAPVTPVPETAHRTLPA